MSSTIHPLPSFGLGTFRLTGQVVVDSVRSALELGYRAIDTAQIYGNEADIGRAIAESGVPRSELFLTTKVWVDNYAREKLLASLRESLEKLRTDRLDLVLIHWPAPGNGVELAEYMAALAEAKSLGLTRRIGVSNFNIELTRQAIAAVGAGEISTNQIELSPYLQNRALTAYLEEQGIAVTSYMTLAYGKVLKDPTLAGIAARHRATVAQVALAWAMQLGYAVIPSSTRRENLASNLLRATCAWTPRTWRASPASSVTAARSVRRAWRRPGTENRVEGPPRRGSGRAAGSELDAVFDHPRLVRHPVVQALRPVVAFLGMPVEPRAATFLGLPADVLDQLLADLLAAHVGRDIEVFQVADVLCRPGRAVVEEVDDAMQAATVGGHGAVHRFALVEEAPPGGLGGLCREFDFIERLVGLPVFEPLLEVLVCHGAYRYQCVQGLHPVLPSLA